MSVSLTTHSHIVIADPRPADYHELAALAGRYGWHVHLMTTGGATLRLARSTDIDLWLLNVRLPDMSGFDLAEMIRDQFRSARVFLVADGYDAEHESQACRVGAALYVCKTADGALDCKALLDALVTSRPAAAEHLRGPPAPVSRFNLLEKTGTRNFAADVPPDRSTHR